MRSPLHILFLDCVCLILTCLMIYFLVVLYSILFYVSAVRVYF